MRSTSKAASRALLTPKRRSKYGAIKTTVDGLTFDSQGEADRYQELRLLQRAGEIKHLQLQVPFPLYAAATADGASPGIIAVQAATYVADFTYCDAAGLVVEDFKGHRTHEYKLKKRWFEACYPGITITETGKRRKRGTYRRKTS